VSADILPQNLWQNVRMADATSMPSVFLPEPGWKDIERGVPIATFEAFAASSGFAMKILMEVIIPARTLKHRRNRKEPLNVDESDRLARVVRLYNLAAHVFGNPEKARKWLSSPKHRFEQRSPLSMMRTESGGHQVEEMLVQIDEGYFA
jgi:putative toxin-antitoxin system antitoxin component (TIGR02293 family)